MKVFHSSVSRVLCALVLLGGVGVARADSDLMTIERAMKFAKAYNSEYRDRKEYVKQKEEDIEKKLKEIFLPPITLSASTSFNKTIGTIPGLDSSDEDQEKKTFGIPEGTSVSLNLLQMNLYNSFQDVSELERLRYELKEAENELKLFELRLRTEIGIFINEIMIVKNKRSSLKRQLSILKSFATIKLEGKKISDEFSIYLNSIKSSLEEEKNNYINKVMGLNRKIGISVNKAYKSFETVKYKKFTKTRKEVLRIYEEKKLKDNKQKSKKIEIQMQAFRRQRLFNASIDFDGITIEYFLDNEQSGSDIFGRSSLSRNIDIGASLSLSIPIWSSNGFLGSYEYEKILKDVEKEKRKIQSENLANDVAVRTLLQDIFSLENRYTIEMQSLALLSSRLDRLVRDFAGIRKMKVENILNLLDKVGQKDNDILDIVLQHLNKKAELMEVLGVTDELF